MSFWKSIFGVFGSGFSSALLTALVVEVKAAIDSDLRLNDEEKAAAKVGIDLLAARIAAKLHI